MKLPSVYPLTIPSSQRMIRMIAIVSSMGVLLRATIGACTASSFSNGCATPRRFDRGSRLRVAALALAAILAVAELAAAQAPDQQPPVSSGHPAASFAKFLAGGATGLV